MQKSMKPMVNKHLPSKHLEQPKLTTS